MRSSRSPEQIKVLDVGCGSGEFVKIARQFGFAAEGLDPNLPPALVSEIIHRKSLSDVSGSSFDFVFLLNVAEHLTEPKVLFEEIRRILKSDGILLLTCPFGDSFARRVHKARWGHLALEEHLLFWTPDSLRLSLNSAGFKGETSYRIAGSPFPYGRVGGESPQPAVVERPGATELPVKERQRTSLQAWVWQRARQIQTHQKISNAIRTAIHLTRTGDYLEFAIAAS